MTPEQQRHDNLSYLVGAWANEHGVDPFSLVLLTKELGHSCMDEGVVSEKVNAKLETPMPVVERSPAVALGCWQHIHRMMTDAQKELDKTPPPDPIINIILSRKRLEDTL